jgi:hypothetical protein
MSREVYRVPMDYDRPMGWKRTDEDWDDEAEQWRVPPPGDGWQMWETTSVGSPMSPVFATPEELARWLADTGASAFGSMTATYEQWLATIRAGYAPGLVASPGRLESGVAAMATLTEKGDTEQ